MSATYFLLLTDHGSTRLAAAQAGTQPFQITHLAIGDANNLPYLPQSRVSEVTLVNEQARVPVQSVAVVGGQVEVVATVDSTVGGFNVHEIGLLDDAGQLLYIGNYHGGYKPILTEGAGGDLELVCVLKTSNLTPVVVEMNPTVVTANRQWVLDHFVRIPTFEAHVEQFNAHVAQYDSHVNQNALEHSNLLSLISQLNTDQSSNNQSTQAQLASLFGFLDSYFSLRNNGLYPVGQYMLSLAPGFEMTVTLVGGGGSGGSIKTYSSTQPSYDDKPDGNDGESTYIRPTGSGLGDIGFSNGGLGGKGTFGVMSAGSPGVLDTIVRAQSVPGGTGLHLQVGAYSLLDFGSYEVTSANVLTGDASGTGSGVFYGIQQGGQAVLLPDYYGGNSLLNYGGGGGVGVITFGVQDSDGFDVLGGGGASAAAVTVSILNTSDRPQSFLLSVGRGGSAQHSFYDGSEYSSVAGSDGFAIIKSNQLNVLT